jgi:hypothetical protein
MRRVVFFSGLLFLTLQLFLNTANASVFSYTTQPEAANACADRGEAFETSYSGRTYFCTKETNYYQLKFDAYGSTFPEDRFNWTEGCADGIVNINGTWSCDVPETPSTCDENGLLFDGSTGSCVDTCPNGYLNGVCLQGEPVGEPNESEDPSGCQPDASDWQGVFEGKHYCDSNLPEPATCPEGEMAYIQTDNSGSGAFVCGEPISEPGEAEESETETTETTTDQDGNTVTETTDGDGNTTTTISDGNGNSSTTDNYPGTDSETGEPCTSASVACYPTPETKKGLCKDGGSLCDDVRDIRDAIDQESDRTEKTGEFNTEQANSEVSQAKTDLETGINSIKSEIGGYFDLALSGGDMVCGPGVDVLGTTIQICPSEMKEELAVIAQIVMLIAALISLMIIFR